MVKKNAIFQILQHTNGVFGELEGDLKKERKEERKEDEEERKKKRRRYTPPGAILTKPQYQYPYHSTRTETPRIW